MNTIRQVDSIIPSFQPRMCIELRSPKMIELIQKIAIRLILIFREVSTRITNANTILDQTLVRALLTNWPLRFTQAQLSNEV